MPPIHVVILGAGPAGLSSALALARLSREQALAAHTGRGEGTLASEPTITSPPAFRITVLEVRPAPTTLGGTINLTPLALRYLDRLGVGERLPRRVCAVPSIDLVSLRTGALLGRVWENVDAVRTPRSVLLDCLLQTCTAEPANAAVISLQFGVHVVGIESGHGHGHDHGVVLSLQSHNGTGTETTTLQADLVLGCDGIHSAVRRLYVDPDRQPFFSGKVVAYGSIPGWLHGQHNDASPRTATAPTTASTTASSAFPSKLRLATGEPAIRTTTLFSNRYGSVLTTFADPARSCLHFSVVMDAPGVGAEGLPRDGWQARIQDKDGVRRDILRRFRPPGEHSGSDGGGGGIAAELAETLEQVDEWTLFPVYQLPLAGVWQRGSVLLLGDAAHAMPPQGESTGVAIEDGVLLAHVFRLHGAAIATVDDTAAISAAAAARARSSTIEQVLADYETLRRPDTDRLYRETTWQWQHAASANGSWLWSIVTEWMTAAFLLVSRYRLGDYFARDVEKLGLPEA